MVFLPASKSHFARRLEVMSMYRGQLQLAIEEFLPTQLFARRIRWRIHTGSLSGSVWTAQRMSVSGMPVAHSSLRSQFGIPARDPSPRENGKQPWRLRKDALSFLFSLFPRFFIGEDEVLEDLQASVTRAGCKEYFQ